MFENEIQEDYWKAIAEDMGTELGVDTREGSVYMDAAAGHILRITKFYNDLAQLYGMYAIDTAYGDVLTEMAGRDGITRISPTPSYWTATFTGAVPTEGTRFLCSEYYFTYKQVEEGLYLLEAETPGAETNTLISGTNLVPMVNIEGLTSAVLGTLYIAGVDEEMDDALRARWRNAKSGPAENGNKAHYKKWCEEVTGIGRARILPLWGGENSVKAVLFAADGFDVTQALVDEVQEYVDPVVDGFPVTVDGVEYIFGDGMGEGVANMGAHFLAASATPVKLVISATIALRSGYTIEQVINSATEQFTTYLRELALGTADDTNETVRISRIGSILAGLESVLDYDDLLINGAAENVIVDANSVAVLDRVSFHA